VFVYDNSLETVNVSHVLLTFSNIAQWFGDVLFIRLHLF
jgi:hypothetical protein